MLLPERLEERRFEWFLAPTRDGGRQRVQRPERDDMELVRVRLIPLSTILSIYSTDNGVRVHRIDVRFRHRSSPPSSTSPLARRIPRAWCSTVYNSGGCIATEAMRR